MLNRIHCYSNFSTSIFKYELVRPVTCSFSSVVNLKEVSTFPGEAKLYTFNCFTSLPQIISAVISVAGSTESQCMHCAAKPTDCK